MGSMSKSLVDNRYSDEANDSDIEYLGDGINKIDESLNVYNSEVVNQSQVSQLKKSSNSSFQKASGNILDNAEHLQPNKFLHKSNSQYSAYYQIEEVDIIDMSIDIVNFNNKIENIDNIRDENYMKEIANKILFDIDSEVESYQPSLSKNLLFNNVISKEKVNSEKKLQSPIAKKPTIKDG